MRRTMRLAWGGQKPKTRTPWEVEDEYEDISFMSHKCTYVYDDFALSLLRFTSTLFLLPLLPSPPSPSFLPRQMKVTCLKFNRSGSLLATGAADGSLRIYATVR